MSTVEQSVQPKKRSSLLVILTVMGGLTGIVLGGLQMSRGLREIFGSGEGAQFKQLVSESDHALDEANKFNQGAAPQFAELLNDVDRLGLPAFHEQKTAAARQVREQFRQAAIEFRNAAEKLTEAAKLQTSETMKSFAAQKARTYELAAEVCEDNQKIVDLVIDKSFEKIDDVLPKMQELAAHRDEALKASTEAAAEADKLGKELTDKKS